MFAARPDQLVARFFSTTGDNLRYAGAFNANVCARPNAEPLGIEAAAYDGTGLKANAGATMLHMMSDGWRYLSLDAWQRLSGQDPAFVKTQASVPVGTE